eukprot:233677-Pelagomonas_calceolata.AAC.8
MHLDNVSTGSEEEKGGKSKKKGHHAPVKKAAAAMAVGIGSLSDPDDLPVRRQLCFLESL